MLLWVSIHRGTHWREIIFECKRSPLKFNFNKLRREAKSVAMLLILLVANFMTSLAVWLSANFVVVVSSAPPTPSVRWSHSKDNTNGHWKPRQVARSSLDTARRGGGKGRSVRCYPECDSGFPLFAQDFYPESHSQLSLGGLKERSLSGSEMFACLKSGQFCNEWKQKFSLQNGMLVTNLHMSEVLRGSDWAPILY